MNAVIYARFSSHAQRDTSIEQQLDVCRRWAQENNYTVIAEYTDFAQSGTTDRRLQFQRMITDSAKHRFDTVLVYKIDRFARNRYDSATYKAKLRKNGVRVISVMEPIPDGPEGILLESVLEGSAEYYSANLSQNVTRGLLDNARNAKVNGLLPFGYYNRNGYYAIDENKAAIVRNIFQMIADGASVGSVVNDLNTKGIYNSKNKPWTANSIYNMLRNEHYIGTYKWRDIVIQNAFPAIVTSDLFTAVQNRPNGQQRSKSNTAHFDDDHKPAPYLLSGILFCGHCKAKMVGISGTSKTGKIHYYYSCNNSRKHSGNCTKTAERRDQLEDLVAATIRAAMTEDVINKIATNTCRLVLEENKEQVTQLDLLKAQLAETNNMIANLIKAIEQGAISPSITNRLNEMEEKKAYLNDEIKIQQVALPNLTEDNFRFALQRLKNAADSPIDRDTLFRIFLSAVYVYDDRIEIDCTPDTTTPRHLSQKFEQSTLQSTKIELFELNLSIIVYSFGFRIVRYN